MSRDSNQHMIYEGWTRLTNSAICVTRFTLVGPPRNSTVEYRWSLN